jgi:hypothetical protein
MTLTYAGIGARATPQDVLGLMTMAAKELSDFGWKLRTGGARGADSAYARGTMNREIHLPWDGYEDLFINAGDPTLKIPRINERIISIAAEHHPQWPKLSKGVRSLMCRNVTIVLGALAEDPADMIICWTPNGQIAGGTGHAMRVGYGFDIPVFNLFHQSDIDRMVDFVQRKHASV